MLTLTFLHVFAESDLPFFRLTTDYASVQNIIWITKSK